VWIFVVCDYVPKLERVVIATFPLSFGAVFGFFRYIEPFLERLLCCLIDTLLKAYQSITLV
jgi:hypothetical protein